MKKIKLLLLMFFISFVGVAQRDITNRTIQNYDLLRDNILKVYDRDIPSDTEIQNLLDTQIQKNSTTVADKTVGGWPDIDYNTNVKTTQWNSREHLYRVKALARAFAESGQSWYGNREVLDAVYLGVEHWAINDYITTNFPGETIYPQQDLMATFLNIEKVEAVPQSYIDQVQFIIDKAAVPKKYTNHNSAWRSETQVLISLFYDDEVTFEKQLRQVYEQYTQPMGEEGIQPDGSFHFHGNSFSGKPVYIVQFGNYGNGFVSDLGWLERAAGTPYAFDDFSNFEHVRNYFANGIGWTYWHDEMDYNLLPRQNEYNKSFDRANTGLRGKEILIKADPSYASEYEKVLTWPNQLIGFKSFWQSDIGICRRADWYASVRMCSDRVLRGESINQQNTKGLHQSDGVLMFQQSGKEYENIGALWDWKMLPGVTCDQGINKLSHPSYSKEESLVETSYAGSIGTQNARGMASMINKREELYARKSWFFDDDVIVCLGSGINGTTAGNVFTTIQQSFLIGDVKDKDGNILPTGQTAIGANDWVYHDNAVYQSTTPYYVDLSFRQDNWSKITTNEDRESEGSIYTAWIDHGNSPNNAGYGYFIYPQADATNITDRISKRPKILTNTSSVHAIEINNRLYASFFEAGSITSTDGTVIEVSAPCLLAIDDNKIYVADPNHNQTSVVVKVDTAEHTITFPTGENTGGQEVVVTDASLLSINNIDEESKLLIYPNPAKDFLNIPNAEVGSTLKIIDISGREIKKQKIKSTKVDVSDLVSGFYLAMLIDDGVFSVGKFLKE